MFRSQSLAQLRSHHDFTFSFCWFSGSACSIYESDKVYLGVRVRMPVKDMLKNIRLSQGQDLTDFQVSSLMFVRQDFGYAVSEYIWNYQKIIHTISWILLHKMLWFFVFTLLQIDFESLCLKNLIEINSNWSIFFFFYPFYSRKAQKQVQQVSKTFSIAVNLCYFTWTHKTDDSYLKSDAEMYLLLFCLVHI